ncbi:MAG: alanine/ornithine racemase family PLP-dependent enzyme [Myxococcota bacterium]|nr:alanine/ornithine racemase family PLP-dependent enzyme [Myxococcota bacterium]
MGQPHLSIDLDKIEHNARAVVAQCHEHGIDVTGVTKGVCGSPEVARAMLRGGVSSLGESRLENVWRLREAGITAPIMMLRLPPLSAADQVVRAVDLSLDSELAVLGALAAASRRAGRRHPVIVMVDLGDLREGVWPDDVVPFVREVLAIDGVTLVGLGANLTCYGGVIPSERNMARLVERVEAVEEAFGIHLPWISGGNSSALSLVAEGRMPPRINHLRIGEAILLGRETVQRRPWPGTHQDAFRLHGEVIECKTKPSVPVGERAEDAFGARAAFPERGRVLRALVNVGREDLELPGLVPLDSRLRVMGASSDYLLVDATEAAGEIRVGDEVAFTLGYGGLLAAMDSAYVEKRYHRSGAA